MTKHELLNDHIKKQAEAEVVPSLILEINLHRIRSLGARFLSATNPDKKICLGPDKFFCLARRYMRYLFLPDKKFYLVQYKKV